MNNIDVEKLLADARGGLSPTDADRSRVYRGVMAAISAPVPSSASSVSKGGSAGGSAMMSPVRLAVPALLLTLGGALVFWNLSPRALEKTAPAAHLPMIHVASETSVADAFPIPHKDVALPAFSDRISGEAVGRASSEKARSTVAVPGGESDDSILAELRLIQQATAALNRRDPVEAGASLAAHRARFPSGVMAQEREGLSIVAMCQRNQMEKAERAHEKFTRTSPDAPVHVRINKECGF